MCGHMVYTMRTYWVPGSAVSNVMSALAMGSTPACSDSLPAISLPICLGQSHLTLMTWIFSILRVAASLVCTKTVKVQPEEARV